MFDILPNLHPAATHFPIALGITASLLLLVGKFRPANSELTATGRLLVSLAALSALFAVALGWQAFMTVDHDAAGHRVMIEHRNWAMAASAGLILVALWDILRQRKNQLAHALLLPAMLALSGMLGYIGWLGGEMVYRHGIGVLPSAFAVPDAPELPAAAEPAPAAAPLPTEAAAAPEGGHVHKDGKRHRH